MSSDQAGRPGDVAGAKGVHTKRPVGIAFTLVDVGPGRGMDDHIGLCTCNRREDRVAKRHVELGPWEADDKPRWPVNDSGGPSGKISDELGAQLTGGTGDKDAQS